jgi:predicted RNase H-like HicB family nuclease
MKKTKEMFLEYRKQPYTRIITPDSETGTFTAEILEFPGCITQGDTIEETYERLERVAESWIGAALNLGQTIPPPSIIQGAGGKIALRLPKSVHQQLIVISEREGTSLNQYILSAISEKIGATNMSNEIIQKIADQIPVFRFNFNQARLEDFKIEGTRETPTAAFVPKFALQRTANNMVN